MYHRQDDRLCRTRCLALLGVVSALSGCARSSSPPPLSDLVAQPTPSGTTVAAEPLAAAPAPVVSAPAAPVAPAAAAPVAPAPSSASNPWTTAVDCSKLEGSAEHRDLPADSRARSLATCEAKEELRAFVASRQSCSAASQCAIVPGSCPFGCYLPVAKASASDVRAKLDALGARLDTAGNRCVYRCMGPPAPVCGNGRCSVAAL